MVKLSVSGQKMVSQPAFRVSSQKDTWPAASLHWPHIHTSHALTTQLVHLPHTWHTHFPTLLTSTCHTYCVRFRHAQAIYPLHIPHTSHTFICPSPYSHTLSITLHTEKPQWRVWRWTSTLKSTRRGLFLRLSSRDWKTKSYRQQ